VGPLFSASLRAGGTAFVESRKAGDLASDLWSDHIHYTTEVFPKTAARKPNHACKPEEEKGKPNTNKALTMANPTRIPKGHGQ